MKKYQEFIAAQALARSLKEEIKLFVEGETSNLYRLVTGCDPILGGIIYLKEKDIDSLLDVIGFISKINNKDDNRDGVIELIDDDKTIEPCIRFADCVIGFLEQKNEKLKEDIDVSPKNANFKLWELFQLPEIEKDFLQLVIAMHSIEEFGDFFETVFNLMSDIAFDELPDQDDDEEDYDVWVDSLIRVFSLMLDTNRESISEILNGSLVRYCFTLQPIFGLSSGISYLMEFFQNNK
jgi:hypothetical protein